MRSLETTSGDLETTSQFGTWKRMRDSFKGLQQLLEVAATVGSYGDCWKLRRLLEAATGCWRGPQYDRKCSFYFHCYFFLTTPTNWDLRQKAVIFSITAGGVAVGKCRVMWGWRLEYLDVRIWESTGSMLGNAHPDWFCCGRLTFWLENKHFNTLAFFNYMNWVEPAMLLSILGTSLRWSRRFYCQCIWAYVRSLLYKETLLFVQKRSNDWKIFLRITRLFNCSISSCDCDVLNGKSFLN